MSPLSRVPPWLVLLLVSPAIGEVLSGSSPPRELLNPVALLFLVGLYGSGALLVREIAFRWRKGWPSVLALGAAYGIVEEALMTKSFFDPGWMDVGVLGSYGRWLGVNWIWSLELTIFHAVFSISIAILLVELAYPGHRDRPWISGRAMAFFGALMSFVVVIGYFFLTPYRPDAAPYMAAVVATGAFIWIARKLPPAIPAGHPGGIPSPRRLIAAGLAWSLALFLLVWIVPHTGVPAIADFALLLALAAAGFWGLARLYARGPQFTDGHKWALASGALGFFLLLSLLLAAGGLVDMLLAGSVASILLFMLWRSLESRSKPLCVSAWN